MNAWGLIILALAGGLLYWSVKHEGTLGDLGAAIGIGTAAAAAAKAAGSVPATSTSNEKTTGSAAGSAADEATAGTAGDLTIAEELAGGL